MRGPAFGLDKETLKGNVILEVSRSAIPHHLVSRRFKLMRLHRALLRYSDVALETCALRNILVRY